MLRAVWYARQIQSAIQVEPAFPSTSHASVEPRALAAEYCAQCVRLFAQQPSLQELMELLEELCVELPENVLLKDCVFASGDFVVLLMHFVQDLLARHCSGKIQYQRDSLFREVFPFDFERERERERQRTRVGVQRSRAPDESGHDEDTTERKKRQRRESQMSTSLAAAQ
jgi:hypothetical protein